MTVVLVTPIRDGELGQTTEVGFKDREKARAFADRMADDGCVGCIKVNDKIKYVF